MEALRASVPGWPAGRRLAPLLRAAVLVAVTFVLAAHPLDAADEPLPLRLPDPATSDAVLDAMCRSATLAGLVASLRERRAVVYVRWRSALPRRLRGAVMLRVIATPEVRYVWIGLRPDEVSDQLVAVVAHEIAHVLEILDAGVTEPSAIASFYRRVTGMTGTHVYETRAAIDTGEQVQRELKAGRSGGAPRKGSCD